MAGVFSLILLCLMQVPTKAAPTVQLTSGVVKGQDITSKKDSKPLYAYYGIPYAQPPIGDLRFRRPIPFRGNGSQEIISSETYRPDCMQRNQSTNFPMSEDCLYLNIFKPADSSGVAKKVMVYITAGHFNFGSVRYPEFTDLVVTHDVIVVTPMYRFGVFGFVTSGDSALPGNNGLADIILALQWVKNNIGNFQGDPHDVTLFGVSSGAMSIGLLSISPLAKDLFTKGFLASGSPFYPEIRRDNEVAIKIFYTIAERTNCTTDMKENFGSREAYHLSIVDCLRTKPASLLEETTTKLADEFHDWSEFFARMPCPTIDGDVLPNDVTSLMGNKSYLKAVGALDRKYLVTNTNNEGTLILLGVVQVNGFDFVQDDDNTNELLEFGIDSVIPIATVPSALDVARFFYTYPRNQSNRAQLKGLSNFIGDAEFVYPSVRFIDALLGASADTIVYQGFVDIYPQVVNSTGLIQGMIHGFDLSYYSDRMRNVVIKAYEKIYEEDDFFSGHHRPAIDMCRNLLASFVKSGKPSWNATSNWPRYDLENRKFVVIDFETEVRRDLYSQRMSFWRQFLPNLRDGNSTC